jgi:hypothetical protein
MRRSAIRFALVVGMLSWPLTALALVPPNVGGLAASVVNGQIAIHWEKPEGENDIGQYRIYYGQKSILDNDGQYDDFLAVSGDRNELIVTDLPPYSELYMAVVAVSSSDEESDSFTQEVRLNLKETNFEGVVTDRESASPSRRQREQGMLGLETSKNSSMTEVTLSFSNDVQIAPDQASDAVSITDGNSQPLKIYKLVLLGNQVKVQTDPMTAGMTYAVRVNPVVQGFVAPNKTLSLDPSRSIGSFTAEAVEAAPSPAPGETPRPSTDIGSTENEVHNFRTAVEPEGDTGRSTVVVGWDAPSVGIVKHYKITPIVGQKLGETTDVGPDTTVVRFRKIPGGMFRVAIQTEFDDGHIVGPTTVTLTIPGEPPIQQPTVKPTKPAAQPGGHGLATTGAGAGAIALVSGAIAGVKQYRRKKKLQGQTEPVSELV